MRQDERSYSFELAVDRVRAGVEATKRVGRPFVFTARADGVLLGSYDMEEALRRARAFAAAGADVVYVPIPPGMEDLARLCTSVPCAVNALAAGPFTAFSVGDFEKIGVRRISLGSSIARAVHRTIHDSVQGMLRDGAFSRVASDSTLAGDEVDRLLRLGGRHGSSEESWS